MQGCKMKERILNARIIGIKENTWFQLIGGTSCA
jgi:hypothetical protein